MRLLQIGMTCRLLDNDYGAVVVRSVRSLDEAIGALAQYEFDAIVLGSTAVDAWPTAAYEQIARLAGATPVLVRADFIRPMTVIKRQHDRQQDIIVATAKTSVLGRLALTAILRHRALAEEPGAQIG